jgi:hypothetical protein
MAVKAQCDSARLRLEVRDLTRFVGELYAYAKELEERRAHRLRAEPRRVRVMEEIDWDSRRRQAADLRVLRVLLGERA